MAVAYVQLAEVHASILHCNKNDFVRINEYDIYYEKRVNFNDYYLNKYMEIKLPSDEIIYIEKVKGNKLIKIDKKGIPYKENDINYEKYNVVEIDNYLRNKPSPITSNTLIYA